MSPKKEEITETSWPRNKVASIETRKRDLVIRISDWTRDKYEPAYDVEVYVAGVYDWNLSETISMRGIEGVHPNRTKEQARKLAVEYAQKKIAELLK